MEPPKAVKLSVSRELNDSIYIEWQRDPTDQNPVDYYVLHQEKNSNSAEVRLPGNQTHYRATSLKCGTRYQFYMIAHNKEGKSPPSEIVSTSTSGALPVVPSKASLIKWINSTCLLIDLNAFQDNGCRMNFFNVRYRAERPQQQLSNDSLNIPGSVNQQQQLIGPNGMMASHQSLTAAGNLQAGGKASQASQSIGGSGSLHTISGEWIAVRPKGNLKQQRVNDEDRLEYLCDLSPTGEYTIHVTAGNDVGRTEVEHTVLMSSDELRSSAFKEIIELMPNFIAYIPSLLVFLLAALSLIIVCLILYTTAIKYYQKFVIMQNQMRATRRAKADEKRRRKLASTGAKFLQPSSSSSSASSSPSRHNQKLSDLWADEYEEGQDEDEDDNSSNNNNNNNNSDRLGKNEQIVTDNSGAGGLSRHRLVGDADDEDEDATDELQSNSSQELRIGAGHRRRAAGREEQFLNGGAVKQGFMAARGRNSNLIGAGAGCHSHVNQQQHTLLRPQQHNRHQHALNYHKYSTSNQQYLPYNLNGSPFDSSSMDSSRNLGKPYSSACMSTASNESSHGRFQCLNAKQYVKMNEYSMLPTISASLAPNPINDIYGVAPQFRPINGTSPSANSSASNSTNSTHTSNNNNSNNNNNNNSGVNNSNNQNSNSMYYSTLRRTTNMQTYLPQQQQQQQRQQLQRRQSQNVADIYGYYMTPPVRAQAQAQAAAAAAQMAANEAANSIFVPPQHQIIYSAPNIRRQPSVFV